MTRIGFIGLGIMGLPMSENLIQAGHTVSVWNRTPSRMEMLVEKGVHKTNSAKEAASNADVIITIVTDSNAVEEVVLGTNGVIEGAHPGSVVIDMSTISPSVTKVVAKRLEETGVHMMDAPVSGGLPGAISGTLSIMVGGEKVTFDKHLAVLKAMGSRVTYCGTIGMGQVTKLANQIIGLGNLAAMCEGLLFASKAGGNPEALLQAFSGGAANSWMLENLGSKVFDRDFVPGFMVDLAQKDLGLVLDAASEIGVPLVTTPIVSQLFRSSQQGGAGREGIQAYIKALETLAGFEVQS